MFGTGYGGIDTSYPATKGIAVTNIPDYATESVAEFTFGILLEQLRDIAKARTQAYEGNYSDDFMGSEIKGKDFGVIGMGNIVRRTAELALVFGGVRYWARNTSTAAEAIGIHYCELDELLENSDIITLNLALNVETEGIINAKQINRIKKGAIFINLSPMELLDFDAVATRLQKNDMTFMFDHSDEMSPEHLDILSRFSNCMIYPPIAYLTEEATALKQQIYVDNLKNYLKNTPTNKVN